MSFFNHANAKTLFVIDDCHLNIEVASEIYNRFDQMKDLNCLLCSRLFPKNVRRISDFDYHDFFSDLSEKGNVFTLNTVDVSKKMSGIIRYCSNRVLKRVVEHNGFVNFRKNVYEILSLLPGTECTIGEWVTIANKILKDNDLEIDLKIKKSKGNITFNQLFGIGNKRITESDCRIGTIHSVKGETFDAVLVILKKKGIGAMYKTMLRNNIKISDEEELRIVYVGITRPRRLLFLAVPDEQNKEAWEKRLFG